MGLLPMLLGLHVLAGVVIFVGGRRLGRLVHLAAAAPLAVSFVAVAAKVGSVLDGATPSSRTTWVRDLSLGFSFRLDGFATLMAMLVSGIGVVVLVYAWGYFADDSGQRVVRFAGWFTLFAGAMLGLVVAADVWTLFTCWELTSVLSFLLIGLDDRHADARAAAQRALLVTGAGGLVMLGGLVCLVHEAGTADLQRILSVVPESRTAQVGLLLVLVGAFSKSAQVPFHFWLPGAMAAPTPVSAFLHSATMVKAGVVVVARLAPAFANIWWWRPLLVVVGGVTMLVGGIAALRRSDAKQSLAFGTVSQLGFLTLLVGIGEPAVTAAGVAMLLAHVLFKSALFLAIGAVEHATGSRDMRRLAGVGRAQPLLAAAAGVCTLSMIGVPPLVGFAAKESALAALLDGGGGWLRVALVAVVAGSVLTTAYSIRLWWGLFAGRGDQPGAAVVPHDVTRLLTVPVMVLASASLAGGIAAGPLGQRLAVAAEALDATAHMHLTLWSGLHLPLLLSALVVVLGSAVAVTVIRTELRPAASTTIGERVFARTYEGLLDGAKRLTRVTQSGSLPVYVAVVFSVVVVAIGVAIAKGAAGNLGHPVLADSVLQGAVAVLATVMSVAVVMARRRFVSVLLLGGVGQALTVLFLMYGAPDLALTQFMIETLMIVAFLLVLRHLPRHYAEAPTWAPRALRIGLALAVGVAVSFFALAAGGVTRPTDVTDAVEALSLPAAGGRNVVNVTIVDFRGVDTMFEITVFGVAALGVANLVASRRRVSGSVATRFARIGAESMIFEQVIRMIFHLTLLVSLYVALRGHNAPGGGFAGGLIAGAAFVFRLLAGGDQTRRRVSLVSPAALIGTGMVLAIGSGLVPLISGNEFLETSVVHAHLPLVGEIELVSAAVFDLGVYVLVIGVVILVLSHLASRTHGGGSSPENALSS
jgi:multicomponent Na+:H+ antiporter subunit A